jgi:hypothetical protein
MRAYNDARFTGSGACKMLYIFFGLVLIGAGVASFWYLLPRDGHARVENTDIGSLITIGIMGLVTVGVVFVGAGILGS